MSVLHLATMLSYNFSSAIHVTVTDVPLIMKHVTHLALDGSFKQIILGSMRGYLHTSRILYTINKGD